MMVTWVGILTALIVAIGIYRPRVIPWALGASAGLSSTVGFVIKGNGAVPFFLFAMVIAAFSVAEFLRNRYSKGKLVGPGKRPLLAFAAYSLLITMVGPVVFRGIPVLMPRGGTDDEVTSPSTLEFTISHFAQASYLVLGLFVVFYLARLPRISPLIPAAGFWVGIGLSGAQLVAGMVGITWPTKMFSNSPNVRYIDFTSDGSEPRFRGIFAEPASLGLFAVTALAFFATSAFATKEYRKAVNIFGAIISALLIIEGRTGTALIGGIIVIAASLCFVVFMFIAGKAKWHPLVFVLIPFLAAALMLAKGRILTYAMDIIDGKVGSASYSVRTASNDFSVDILIDTVGFGAGLGSSKPNSFFAMLISCVGVIGTVLFVIAILLLIKGCWKHPEARASAWALLAFFLVKAVGGSTMSTPIMFVLMGVCAHYAWKLVPTRQAVSPSRTMLVA